MKFIRFLLIKWLSKLLAPYGTLSVIATVDLYYDALNKCWAFNDASRDIKAEAFSEGIGKMIDRLIMHKPFLAEDSCRLSFSSVPFSDYEAHLEWSKQEDFGNWYRWTIADNHWIDGWLCPVLGQYFAVPPQHIYAKIEASTEVR